MNQGTKPEFAHQPERGKSMAFRSRVGVPRLSAVFFYLLAFLFELFFRAASSAARPAYRLENLGSEPYFSPSFRVQHPVSKSSSRVGFEAWAGGKFQMFMSATYSTSELGTCTHSNSPGLAEKKRGAKRRLRAVLRNAAFSGELYLAQ